MRAIVTAVQIIENEDLIESGLSEAEKRIQDMLKAIRPFGIKSNGEIIRRTKYHNSFSDNNILCFARAETEGFWLSYLHARRKGVISKLK